MCNYFKISLIAGSFLRRGEEIRRKQPTIDYRIDEILRKPPTTDYRQIDGLGWTRTSGLLLRRQSLYPPELQARAFKDVSETFK
jgi:hypothetical protein